MEPTRSVLEKLTVWAQAKGHYDDYDFDDNDNDYNNCDPQSFSPKRAEIIKPCVVMLSVVNSTKLSWNELDFSKLQEELEGTAFNIAAAQENGRISRKNLVDIFLNFRSAASEEIKKTAAPVLKSFQGEVDNLTSRSEKAENAFMNVYRRLAEMPDPSLALAEAQAIYKKGKKLGDLELENKRLRETIDELKNELVSVRDSDAQLKKALARITEVEESTERTIAVHKNRLENKFDEREKQVAQIIIEANKRTLEADTKTHTLYEALGSTQSELFDLQTRMDEIQKGKSKEVEILLDDLEKANERISLLERENSAMGSVSLQTDSQSTTENLHLLTRIEDLESSLERKQHEFDSLKQQTELTSQEYNSTTIDLQNRLASTLMSLQTSQVSIELMESELAEKTDYAELKRELEVLRSIEFPADLQIETVSLEGNSSSSLEIRLRQKNEQLRNRIACISADKDLLEAEVLKLRQLTSNLLEREKQQTCLIGQLEEDIKQISTWRHKQEEETDLFNIHPGSPPAVLEEIELGRGQLDLSSVSAEAVTATFDEPSILVIVQSQRDRFRDQARQLEENMLTLRRQLLAVQSELETVRQDNVKLYEKIKFVQNYSVSASSIPKSGLLVRDTPYPTLSSPSTSVHQFEADNAEEQLLARYSHVYEARLNPFEQFGRDERSRRYQALKPHEKLIHILGRLIMNNKGARLAAFTYTAALHLLVFLVLYRMAHTMDVACHSSSSLP